MTEPVRYVNVVPTSRLKQVELPSSDIDTVHCRLCPKEFASEIALRNHACIEHIDAYATGNPAVWTSYKNKPMKSETNSAISIKTEQVVSEMEPTSIMALASNDVNYVIIKAENEPDSKKKKYRIVSKQKEDQKVETVVIPKKKKSAEPITGPFECLQPSSLVEDGICHQIFFSCCEYSIHFRDEHTKRKKCLICQVCEKSLAFNCEEQPSPYLCKICSMGFQTNEELMGHTSIYHVKLKPFPCTICHKRFTQQGGLLQHMRMHTGDRPFTCTYCIKSFTQKSGLDQHLRTHTKEKPYRCVVCNKTFCQSVHLRQHMRTHTNVAPFQCVICDKRFKQSSHLNVHLKVHNPATMTDEQKSKYSELIGIINTNKDSEEIEETQPSMDIEVEIATDNIDFII